METRLLAFAFVFLLAIGLASPFILLQFSVIRKSLFAGYKCKLRRINMKDL